MNFTRMILYLFSASLFASGTPEFDLNRFKDSSFHCTNNADCNFGICSPHQYCECQYGYRDSLEAPCDHAMPVLDKYKPWVLETSLGWLFPVGWLYAEIWPTALLRIAIELTGGGMLFGYFWHRDKPIQEIRQENFKALGYLTGASLFNFIHLAGWIGSSIYLSLFDINNKLSKNTWGKTIGQADLVVMADQIPPSIRITLQNFEESDCAIVEQCIDGSGERRLLKFDAYICNVGSSDFVAGLEQVAPVWSACHQHFHGPETAQYFVEQQIVNNTGGLIRKIRYGHKQGYCYIDSYKFNSSKKGKFNCGIPHFTRQLTQGITAGFCDIYDAEIDCQWIDITGLSPGTYQLLVTVNPRGIYYQDATLTNNLAIIEIDIPEMDKIAERKGHGRHITSRIIQGIRS